MTLSFINVLLGFLLGSILHTITRDNISGASPTKFSFIFWIKDNYLKVIHSLVTSCAINLLIQLNLKDVEVFLGFKWIGIYSFLVGLCPDIFLSFLKDKLRILQPKTVKMKDKTYERK